MVLWLKSNPLSKPKSFSNFASLLLLVAFYSVGLLCPKLVFVEGFLCVGLLPCYFGWLNLYRKG